MKVLLDENLPLDLRHFLPDHTVFTVAFMGWKGVKNGNLLAQAAAEGFDVPVSRDAGIRYQQNPATLPISIVLLPPFAKKIEDIIPLVPRLLTTLSSLPPKTFTKLPYNP